MQFRRPVRATADGMQIELLNALQRSLRVGAASPRVSRVDYTIQYQ
ncbi:hypothetical protein [Bordetella sp. BOR01]|nr:hypothetical protein [Bordetella sp. BOR01]MBV7484290.1 hypothetical protein [Bordetella sp. BOR01]